MSTVKRIKIDQERAINCRGLRSNQSFAPKRACISDRGRAWIIDSAGHVRCSNFGDLRCRRHCGSTVKDVPLNMLDESDIKALGELGVLDAQEVAGLKLTAIHSRVARQAIESIAYDVNSLAEAGISVPKSWKKKAERHAAARADAYMKKSYPQFCK